MNCIRGRRELPAEGHLAEIKSSPADNDPVSTFIAVTNIKDVPTSMMEMGVICLSGTVEPENATNKAIEWSLINVDNTIAEIVDEDYLAAFFTGTITVKATIANGTTSGSYKQIFTIEVGRRDSLYYNDDDNWENSRIFDQYMGLKA